jgi:hypothetical protein
VYAVVFDSSVVGCGWTATLNDNDVGGAKAGEITVERKQQGVTTDLLVRTFDSNGQAADPDIGGNDGFTLMVICP